MFSPVDFGHVITATGLELRAGTRILLADTTLRLHHGDRVGLVGRNGAGKTTTLRVLAGEGTAFGGTVSRSGPIGYLPQDPREGDLDTSAKDRVLSARGLDVLVADLEKVQIQMAELTDKAALESATARYGRIEERFASLGGYAAESEAARICSNLGLPDRVLAQPMRTLSGGQRRRVELARILFAASTTEGTGGASDASGQTMLLLDEPTNHLDADSVVWLRDYLRHFAGGVVIISHDVDLLAAVVNKVWFLDAVRGELDVYNMTWQRYLEARATDEQRRRRERANAEKKASALLARAAKIRFPQPAPCGRTPLTATNLSKSYGSLEIFTGVDLAIDRGSRVVVLGLNGAGKTTLLKLLGGFEAADTGEVLAGHGLRLGYYAQEHETIDPESTVWENTRRAAPDAGAQELRNLLGAFLFSGEQLDQRAGTLSGGEKTRLALAGLVSSAANVLLLDEPTNNLDPASREQVLDALRRYAGAVVLVTHDPGAVTALHPERVILLPDGTEDHWSADYLDLVELA